MEKMKSVYGIKIPRPSLGFMFNVEKGLERLKSRKRKSVKTAYWLAIFLGPFGAHHFYLNRWFLGCMYLCSFGILGIGWIIDLFRITSLVEDENDNDDTHRNQKGLLDAYLIWIPFGLVGWHHFYMKNFTLGFLYLTTCGVYGVGWVLDGFFMPSLIEYSNTKEKFSSDLEILKTYLIAASPFGIIGGHQYYSGRKLWGLAYTLTLGGVGIWWMFDLFRISAIVHRRKQWKMGVNLHKIYADDVYLVWIWFGLLGGHHFYMKKYKLGFVYLFTVGCFGVGWLVDLIRIPWMVRDYNLDRLPQDDMVFSDALMENLSDFDRKEIQRVIRHARYSSGEENSVFDDESEDSESFTQEMHHIRSSVRSLNRPNFFVGTKSESSPTTGPEKSASQVTTVAIISNPDESVASANKALTDKVVNPKEKHPDDATVKRSSSGILKSPESMVVLNPQYLSNSLDENCNDSVFVSESTREKVHVTLPGNLANEQNFAVAKDQAKVARQKSKGRRVSFHIGNDQYDVHDDNISNQNDVKNKNVRSESPTNVTEKNFETPNDTDHNDDPTITYAKNETKTINQQNETRHKLTRRVKSDAAIEMMDNRKRKLLRSNTQITTLSWNEPQDHSILISETNTNVDGTEHSDQQNSLPRITKIRSVKKAKPRTPRKKPTLSSATTQTTSANLDCHGHFDVNGHSCVNNSLSFNQNSNQVHNGENGLSNNISNHVLHLVTSATLDNVEDDIEEINVEHSLQSVAVPSPDLIRPVRDTGIGIHNVLPEQRQSTKRSLSFPSRQISLEQNVDNKANSSLIMVDDDDDRNSTIPKLSGKPVKRSSTQSSVNGWTNDQNSATLRRASTQSTHNGWAAVDKANKPIRRSSTQSGHVNRTEDENKHKKGLMSFKPKLTRAKSDAHTPVVAIDDQITERLSKDQIWT